MDLRKTLSFAFAFCLWVPCVLAQQPAFPGAEGGGKFATGGRGGTVYEVTNLNDSGTGSLRDAISAPNRTVIFRVSGVIRLNSTLRFTKDNITVAGQTAPGDGICITGYTVSIQASNIIIRYIRSRLGDETLIEDDAMHSTSGPYQNIIIDHCSLSWSVDETGTFYDIKNFTLQWSILSESLYHSVHDKGDHGYGGIWGGNNSSFLRNLIAHHTSRNPRFGGSRYTGKPAEEIVDFRNNVLYNWGNINSVYGGEGGNYNMVNNYYKPGPATPGSLTVSSTTNKRNRILQYTSYYYATDAAVYPDTLFGGKFYIDGNYVKAYPDVTADNWSRGVQRDSYSKAAQLIAAAKQAVPFSTEPVATLTAEEAYVSVLNSVGATLPVRDAIDKRIISEVEAGTATYEGATYAAISGTGISHPSGIIDTPSDAGGLPVYNSIIPPADTDHDGMPDAWEASNGLNQNDPADGNIVGGDGYSNLEKYLNSLTVASAAMRVRSSLNSFVQFAGNPSPAQVFSVYGLNLTGDIVIHTPPNFEISSDGGNTWNNSSTPITLNQSGGIVVETNLSIRLNASALGSSSGVVSITCPGITTVELPITGITTSNPVTPPGTNTVVAKDGSGNFMTVQAAINAAPANIATPYIIYIKKGVYREKINIPSNKPFIQLIGESVGNTILTFDDYSGKPMPGGGTFGTSNSASVTVSGADFTAVNITFENSTGDAPQALAININADRAAFKNCRFHGGQDTMLNNGAGNRQYFKHCYIDGVVDFIFGNAIAVFDSCVVYARTRVDGLSGSYITAANTPAGQAYGFVFRNSTLPTNAGVTKYVLGRPWQNATGFNPVSYPKVVFINAILGHNQVKPEGWAVWDAGTVTSSTYYGEYKSKKFNGSPVDVTGRVNWSYQLTDPEAASYTTAALFGSWDPCGIPMICTDIPSAVAVSNFKGAKGPAITSFSWNIDWAMKDVRFEIFRSTDHISFSKINETLSVNDSSVNFSYSENIPPPGKTYYYFMIASKAGKDPFVSGTIEISTTPAIQITGTLGAFLQGGSVPSAIQAYTVSGVNLTGSITIQPPQNFEISSDGTTWFGNASQLVLSQSGGNVSATTISVRLNATNTGTYTGSIVHSSTGAVSINQSVSGTAQQDPLSPSQTIQYWPLSVNNQDDAGSRSAGVSAGSPTFKKLFLSNGTTVASVPAFSSTHGMAFGPGVGGEALWTVANGGPGGNINRGIYEQFTIVPVAGYAVRVDSIVLKASFYNTSSNTRFAVVYSKSGFTSNDSTDVTGGVGPDGQPLISTANGAVATPVLLTNETGGTTRRYGFALSGAGGVQLAVGQSLTIRLYFSCGSTSSGRYAKIKDVYIKGYAVLKPVLSRTGTLNNFSQTIGSASASQTYSISGANLNGNVTITPPVNFEISSNNGVDWHGSASPIVLTPSAGVLSSTSIAVRLNASVKGPYSGNISHTSSGADNLSAAVTGTTSDAVTGLELSPDFNISPNPASRVLTVFHPSASEPYLVTVYTVLGQKILSLSSADLSTETSLDISSLSGGLYLVGCEGNGIRIMRRFIKQ